MKTLLISLGLILTESVFFSFAIGLLLTSIAWWKIIPAAFAVCFLAHYIIKTISLNAQNKKKDAEDREEFERAHMQAQAEIAKLEALAAQSIVINCPACNHEHAVQVRLNEDNMPLCPRCNAEIKLLISVKPVVRGATGPVGPLNMGRDEIRSLFSSKDT